MGKQRKEFRLSSPSLEYINTYADKYCNGNATAALEQIISEHAHHTNADFAALVADTVLEKLDSTLVRIRLGSNGADRNSQIILELLNGLYAYYDIPKLISTDELTTPALEEAKTVVKERIENYRIKKLERDQKKEE